MVPRPRTRAMLIRFLLLTVNVWLGAELVSLATSPVEPMPAAAHGRIQAVRSEASAATAEALRPAMASYDRHHALSRPLFSPDRRPWQPPAEEPVEAAPVPEPAYQAEPEPEADFILIGIGVARGQARALLMSGAGDELGWVAEGETVFDWTISAISERSITIERAEREVSLNLHADATQD